MFSYNSNVDYDDRFVLHLDRQALSDEDKVLDKTEMYSYGKTVYIKTSEPIGGVVNIYDLTGRIVLSKELDKIKSNKIETNLANGVFVVELITDKGSLSSNIILK